MLNSMIKIGCFIFYTELGQGQEISGARSPWRLILFYSGS